MPARSATTGHRIRDAKGAIAAHASQLNHTSSPISTGTPSRVVSAYLGSGLQGRDGRQIATFLAA